MNSTKEKLKLQFENYNGSSLFIELCFKAFEKCGIKEKQTTYFINNHFRQEQKLENNCDYAAMRKLAAHWNNVSFDKLNNFDYINYQYCLFTVAKYRIIAKEFECFESE
jgi:hypothetical protein